MFQRVSIVTRFSGPVLYSIAPEERVKGGEKLKESIWQYWIVLWSASYAKFPVGRPFWAVSAKGALDQARRKTVFGAFSVTSSLLSAVPAGTDYSVALAEHDRMAAEAEADQAAASAPSTPVQLDLCFGT